MRSQLPRRSRHQAVEIVLLVVVTGGLLSVLIWAVLTLR